jgi:hypothetical protein
VSENKVLRRMFGPAREEVTARWRKLLNKELNNLYSSSNMIRFIKWKMRLEGYIAYGEELKIRNHLEDMGIDRRIILRCSFKEVGCSGVD